MTPLPSCWIFHHIPLCLILTWSCTGFMSRNEFIWLHVEKRIYFKYITVIFKCLNNIAPKQLSSKLKLLCAFEMLLHTNNFVPSSSWGKRSFSYLAPRLWNALPIEMRITTNIERFKSSLNQFLFTDFRA